MIGQVIQASEKIEMFIANDSMNVVLAKKYLSEAQLTVKYCSIYEKLLVNGW